MVEQDGATPSPMRARGLSGMVAAVIMIVVILVVGGLGYAALNGAGGGSNVPSSSTTKTTCFPATAIACTGSSAAHDATLSVPFKSVQQGTPVPFTATLPAGLVASSFTFFFGDGSNQTTANSQVTHTYSNPGSYIGYVTATVSGNLHDNLHQLVGIVVLASASSANSANTPSISGAVTANSTSTASPSAVIGSGGYVALAGSYTGAPTNPLYTTAAPTFVVPTGATGTPSVGATGGTANLSFANPGWYVVTFVGSATGPGGVVAYQNYTWSVYVGSAGAPAALAGGKATVSPHPGTLSVYELAPGGSNSEDPAIDYETLGYEPIVNVYEQLIAYNGSETGPSPSDYVPVLASCVPGSTTGANNCVSLYGNSLQNGNQYTFVIDKNARFYDPSTGNSWPVYPTDVVFSLARTMSFADLPFSGSTAGWILTQSLLPAGNPSWSAIHHPYNNTPQNIMNAMAINGSSSACTAAIIMASNGCVTFTVDGAGPAGTPVSWPYFLELIADPLGGSIVPCGWFSAPAQGAGIPYWTEGNVTGSGDHPCAAMGSGMGVPVGSIPATAWDTYQQAGSSSPYIGNVQFHMAGSGPYYLQSLLPATSYSLQKNPAYAPNAMCTWKGCWPQLNSYVPSVSVTWETSQVPGEQGYESGTADFASIPATDTAFLLQLLGQGKIAATSFPSISIFFFPYDMDFNLAAAKGYTTNPITAPTDFFSSVAMRQFFTHSYPYATVESTINTKDGIQYLFNYGGAIPQFMANYYPTNVSWPTGDPSSSATTVGTAAWWWAQATTSGSPYYNANVSNDCTVASPCQLPFFGETGSPSLDQATALWAAEINSLSGGRIKLNVLDINFVQLVIASTSSGPYNNPFPVFTLGWAPDYPDPTDYVTPLYFPDGTYTASDAVAEQFANPAYNAASCHASSSLADLIYWANTANGGTGIANNCQGAAYAALIWGMDNASTLPAGPQRVLVYNMVEQIANSLALYTYWGQQNEVITSASWIDPTTFNSNVTIGGGSDSTWFTIQGNGII